eukprot:UN20332
MGVSYIMDSGKNSQDTTFCNFFSLKSADPADLLNIEKILFFEKIPYFWTGGKAWGPLRVPAPLLIYRKYFEIYSKLI